LYHYAEGQQFPALAADLVRRQVAMIFAVTAPAALAAKSATTTIPIVFATGADPVEGDLVASLNHPGINITGVTILTQELIAKRMQLLHEIVPAAATIGYLLDPTGSYPEAQTKEAETAARALAVQLRILNASTLSQVETAFAALVERRIGALMIGNGFVPRNTGEDPESHKPGHETIYGQLPRLAARHGMPVIYAYRQFVDAGGLISYGASLDEEPAPMRAAL
jgi:putative ABC transport system substrate-binding protein